MSKLEITSNGLSYQILINGQDVAPAVVNMTLYLEPDALPQLVLTLGLGIGAIDLPDVQVWTKRFDEESS